MKKKAIGNSENKTVNRKRKALSSNNKALSSNSEALSSSNEVLSSNNEALSSNNKASSAFISAVLWGILLVFMVLGSGCGLLRAETADFTGNAPAALQHEKTNQPQVTGKLDIYTLDIGQGDAHLIRAGDQWTLIDTGDVEHRPVLAARLKEYGVKKLDQIIITHPHSDHLGGLYAVLQNVEVGRVYDNGLAVRSSVYRTYLKELTRRNIPRQVLRAGDQVQLGGGAVFNVYAPWPEPIRDKKGAIDENSNSIVGKLVFGKFSMLFTGDAERAEEDRLVKEQNSKLFSRVLKVGHHGSDTSSSVKFIRSVKPELAVISAGLHNDYHHPSPRALERLQKEKIIIFRTDLQGTIHIRSDGAVWTVSTGR